MLQAMIRGEVPPPPVAQTVGMRLVAASDGQSTFELDVEQRHANPMGTVHGGILCDVADGAMGVAFASTLGDGESFTTLELKINFLRPFWTGLIRAHGKVVDRGRTVGLVECRIVDADGRQIAHAT